MSDGISPPRFPELGFYTLAGGAQNPRDLVIECQRAEELGLGAVFISERFNVKEAVTLSGAAAVATTNMQIITGATNHHRVPDVHTQTGDFVHVMQGGITHCYSAYKYRLQPRHRGYRAGPANLEFNVDHPGQLLLGRKLVSSSPAWRTTDKTQPLLISK